MYTGIWQETVKSDIFPYKNPLQFYYMYVYKYYV